MALAVAFQAWPQDENLSPAASVKSAATGQLTIVPKLGVNYSTTSIDTWPGKSSGFDKPDISGVAGVVAGVEAEYAAGPRLGVSAALLYSMQGRKYDDVSSQERAVKAGLRSTAKDAVVSTEHHHYINLPLTANYYVMERLAVRAGLQVGCLFHQSGTLELPYDDTPKHSINGSPAKFDISIPVGVSYTLDCGVQVDLRYIHGLNKLSWSDGVREERNRVVQLTVGYRLKKIKLF